MSYDIQAGATYVTLTEHKVARTVSVSDLVMVDLDDQGQPVGVEFVVPPAKITSKMLDRLSDRFPTLKNLHDTESWLLTRA